MTQDAETISRQEAAHEVELVSRRLGLLHLAFARTLVDELGEPEGTRLILKAIKCYGTLVGREVKAAVQAAGMEATPENYGTGKSRGLPGIGMHEKSETVEVAGKERQRAYGCVMAKVWKEYGEDRLGRLYCYVDPAKYMAYNPAYKMAHIKALPDGDPHCEFCIKRTTAREREAFAAAEEDWAWIDGCGENADEG
jgi:hypothetical protein